MSRSSVDTLSLPPEKLDFLAGRYKLDFQVPEIGDYLIGVEVLNNRLYVNDPNDDNTVGFTALSDTRFINLDTGDEIFFQVPEDSAGMGLLWDDRYQFHKIPE